MLKVDFHDEGFITEEMVTFVVLVTKYKQKWVIVRHRDRDTWELPGGRCEKGESLEEAARRELYEETGAVDFRMYPVCLYSVECDEMRKKSFGKLYLVEMRSLADLPGYEIEELKLVEEFPASEQITYPEIQPILYRKVRSFIDE